MQVVCNGAMAAALRNEFELSDIGHSDIKGVGSQHLHAVVRELRPRR